MMDIRDLIILVIIVAFSVTLFLGVSFFQYNNPPYQAAAQNAPEQTGAPGSDRDAHGCIPSAGYSWCEAQAKCLRPFETPCIRLFTEDFPPYNYLSANGTINGQSTQIVMEILRRLNSSGSIALMNWSDSYNAVLGGNVAGLFSTARTTERENLFKWVGPIGTYDYIFYSKNGSSVKVSNLDDAKKAGSICVVKDDARDQFLQENGFTNIKTATNDMSCIGMVVANDATLWLGSSADFEGIATEGGYQTTELVPLYKVTSSELFIAFSNDTPSSTVQSWQMTLDAMKADGTYAAIAGRFSDPEVPGRATNYTPCFIQQSDWKIVQATEIVDLELESAATLLGTMANTADAKSGNISRIQAVLVADSQQYPAAVHWYALPNGTYYTTSGLSSANIAKRPYFVEVLAGNVSIGSVVASKSTGKNVVVVAVPVFKGGNVSGVLGVSLYLDNISQDTAGQLRMPNDVHFFAVDQDGQTVLDKETEKILSADPLLGDSLPYVLGNKSGSVDYSYQGETMRGIFKRSDLTGWTFVISYVPSDIGQCGA